MMDSSADIASTVSTFVDEVNSGRIEAALARFTGDVTIVEDLAPYRWQGPDAGAQWLTAMASNAERIGVTAVVMDLGRAQRIEVEGAAGYAIFAGTVLLKGLDETLREAGLLTFALERHSDQWLIGAMTWTGERPTKAWSAKSLKSAFHPKRTFGAGTALHYPIPNNAPHSGREMLRGTALRTGNFRAAVLSPTPLLQAFAGT